MCIDSSNVLAVPDPQEVDTITSQFIKIDQVVMTQMGFRSDEELSVTNLVN